jgi:ketosteroid isomerase-like protein
MNPELQALLDKEAIRELVQIYCRAADRQDHDLMRSLYHEDAIDDHGPFFKGPAMEFIDSLPEIQKPMETLHHNVTNHNIELHGDRAEGEVYVLAFHKVATDGGSVDLLIGGRYLDKYEKRNGAWKFSHRAVVADWANLHDPSIVDLDNPMIEGSYIGRPGTEDPSYDFFMGFQRGPRRPVSHRSAGPEAARD